MVLRIAYAAVTLPRTRVRRRGNTYLKYSTSSVAVGVPLDAIARKFASTCGPESAMHRPRASGWPMPPAGVVVPSVVYTIFPAEAQTFAKRAPPGGIVSPVGDVSGKLC
jgi:hypothetical protein